jgi:hypothetical protein
MRRVFLLSRSLPDRMTSLGSRSRAVAAIFTLFLALALFPPAGADGVETCVRELVTGDLPGGERGSTELPCDVEVGNETVCATGFLICVTPIAVPTVTCGRVTLSIHQCSAVATGGAHGVSFWGFQGSVSWRASYTGMAADAFTGTLSGACDWLANTPEPGSCQHTDESPTYTKICTICTASAAMSVTTAASAVASFAGFPIGGASSTAHASEHDSFEG